MVPHLPISKINLTNILPNSLTKETDASPVYFTDNPVELDTIRKKVGLERLVRVFPYPITTQSRRSKRNKISRFTSINDFQSSLTKIFSWVPDVCISPGMDDDWRISLRDYRLCTPAEIDNAVRRCAEEIYYRNRGQGKQPDEWKMTLNDLQQQRS